MLAGRVTWVIFAGLWAGVVLSAAEPTAATTAPTAWDVYQVVHTSCAECHGGHLAKPKGKLGYILDLQRLIEEKYITPGDPERSDVYTALISTDEDEQMPPPDSEGHKPTAEEIETIRAWIAAGALTGAPAPAVDAGTTSDSAASAAKSPQSWQQTLGRLHPMLVHFPIALLLCACATEIASRLRSHHAGWLQGATRGTLWIAAIGGIIAAACGWLNAAHEGFASDEVETHRWLGVGTATLAVISLLASELAERARARDVTRGSRTLLLVLLIASAIIVSLAGHTGGVLAWGEDYLPFF